MSVVSLTENFSFITFQRNNLLFLSLMNIVEALSEGPRLITEKSDIVIEKRRDYDQAKFRLQAMKASATIKHQEAKNARILEALIALEPEVQSAELELIAVHAALKIAEIDLQQEENAFISARKFSSLGISVGDIKKRPPELDQ